LTDATNGITNAIKEVAGIASNAEWFWTSGYGSFSPISPV
jgi:hypothetical protein